MITVIDNNTQQSSIPFRKPTTGPELETVYRFVSHYSSQAGKRLRTSNVVIFVEPRLETRYPDILIAQFNPRRVHEWCTERDKLSKQDRGILSSLLKKPNQTEDCISRTLGFSAEQVAHSLAILHRCHLVQKSPSGWEALSRSHFFALNRLIAIEAKTNNANAALLQAARNKTFTSSSYSLLGQSSLSNLTKRKYEDLGIGAIVGESFLELIPANKQAVPICHTSLLINDWVSRQSFLET